MPESPLETHELREQLEEAVEHGHGGHEHGEGHGKGAGWVMYLSLSTAFIAVIAAIAALYAGGYANEAILLKNDAVLKKSTASDKYNEYESRKIKSHIYTAQADSLPADKADLAAKYRGIVKDELEKGKAPFAEAQKLDAESAEKNEEAEGLLQKHEIMARAVTLFQVAIALSAIAALTKRKFMWYLSMAFGLSGIVFAGWGFRPHASENKAEKPASAEVAPSGEKPPAGEKKE